MSEQPPRQLPGPLVRRFDWEHRLVEFLMDCRKEKICLDWEFINCTSWVCDAIEVMTGVDLYAEFRGDSTIKSPASAMRAIKNAGFGTLTDVVASRLNPKPLAFATKGDVILYPIESVSVFGVSTPTLDLEPFHDGGPRPESDRQKLLATTMPYALCIGDPPVAWNLTEEGLISVPINSSCLAFDVGGLICLQQ